MHELKPEQIAQLLGLLTQQMEWNVEITGVLVSILGGDRKDAIEEIRTVVRRNQSMEKVITNFLTEYSEILERGLNHGG